MAQLQIRRLGYALGAEIRGVDLRRPLDKATVDEIWQAWMTHLVLRFPDQELTKDEFVTFGGYFGDVDNNPNSKTRDPENEKIIFISNKFTGAPGKPWDGYKEGGHWHSDRSIGVRPTALTFLLAKEMPEVGGNTLWANQEMAYDTLSPKMKEVIEDLQLVHDVQQYMKPTNYLVQAPEVVSNYLRVYPPAVHPVVRVNPDNGRKALYVGDRVYRFAGMTVEESRPLLDVLNAHATRYEFQYRHRWHENDLMVWDNRSVLHRALSDFEPGQIRHLWKCSIFGAKTGRLLPEVETRELVGAPS